MFGHQWLLPLSSAAAIIAIVAASVGLEQHALHRAAASEVPQRPKAVALRAASATHPEPSYLPPGAQRAFAGAHPRFTDTWIYSYTLPGPANAGAGLVPAVNLDVLEVPGSETQQPPADQYYGEEQRSVGGHAAVLSFPKNGYGSFRIDWTNGSSVFTVRVDRLDTGAAGVSGISTDELLKVARSMNI